MYSWYRGREGKSVVVVLPDFFRGMGDSTLGHAPRSGSEVQKGKSIV